MRVLLSGGAGCLGAAIVDHLQPRGVDILVIDNYATGKPGNLPPRPGLTVVEGTIADQTLIRKLVLDFAPSHIVHSAASYKNPNDWIEDANTNVFGAIHLVAAAKEARVERLINFQTALCYGRPKQVPIPIDHATNPFTSYGISKTAGEQIIAASGLPFVSLRLANVTGPRLAIGPIPTFYKRLKAGQKCFCTEAVRDFLDLDDFLNLFDLVLPIGGPTGIFNVSTGEGHTIKDVFDQVVRHLSLTLAEPVPVVPVGADDVAAVVLDPSETERVFKWRARYGFEETMARMLGWYDRHGVTDVFSHLAAPAEARS